MHKTIATLAGGEHIPMTAEEIAARQSEEANPQPLPYNTLRQAEYPSTESLIVALWEMIAANPAIVKSEEFRQLEAQRQAVKQKYPKPGS